LAVKRIGVGAVGYVQWQATKNSIRFTPTNRFQTQAVNALEDLNANVYAAGPGTFALARYRLFSLCFYEEFEASATPSGHQLMFSVAF
jgi:hypothetical protein